MPGFFQSTDVTTSRIAIYVYGSFQEYKDNADLDLRSTGSRRETHEVPDSVGGACTQNDLAQSAPAAFLETGKQLC